MGRGAVASTFVGFVAGLCSGGRLVPPGGGSCSTFETSYSRSYKEMPVPFSIRTGSGDLISRINDDTDRLHQFICGLGLIQIVTGVFLMEVPASCSCRFTLGSGSLRSRRRPVRS